MKRSELLSWLKMHSACDDGIEWIEDTKGSVYQLWKVAAPKDILWLLDELKIAVPPEVKKFEHFRICWRASQKWQSFNCCIRPVNFDPRPYVTIGTVLEAMNDRT